LSGTARRIVVVGIVNIDLLLRCPQVPAAGEHGEPLLLIQAPAQPLPAELLQSMDLLVPNAHRPALPTTVRDTDSSALVKSIGPDAAAWACQLQRGPGIEAYARVQHRRRAPKALPTISRRRGCPKSPTAANVSCAGPMTCISHPSRVYPRKPRTAAVERVLSFSPRPTRFCFRRQSGNWACGEPSAQIGYP